jgi:phosphonopyruvate decarboxylase
MTGLLDAMEIPWFLLPRDPDGAAETILTAGRVLRTCMGPVAIIVGAGTFERYELKSKSVTNYAMNREDAIKRILEQLDEEDVVVSTTGKASREVYEFRQAMHAHGIDFLTVGGMGHTASIAMGIARAQPDRRVVCLDGDGSAIMHMGALGVIGNSGPSNLLHVVINNGAHDSVGGQPTVGYDIDIPAIAAANGYRETASATDPEGLEKQIRRLLVCEGPSLLEVRVNKGARPDLGRPATTPVENRDSLMGKLGL